MVDFFKDLFNSDLVKSSGVWVLIAVSLFLIVLTGVLVTIYFKFFWYKINANNLDRAEKKLEETQQQLEKLKDEYEVLKKKYEKYKFLDGVYDDKEKEEDIEVAVSRYIKEDK